MNPDLACSGWMYASILAPSLLAGDHSNLAACVAGIERLGIRWLHVDIMDGHFVPNLSFGPQTVAALRKHSTLFFDVHLMLSEPHRYIEAFAKAGASQISVHIEPDYDHAGTLQRIHELGCKAGIVLNPGTPTRQVESVLHLVDLVLVMTVQPGFGGQSFRPEMMPKLIDLAAQRENRHLDFRLEVDGGIDVATAAQCRQAGADTFVAGTSFFAAGDQAAFVRAIESS